MSSAQDTGRQTGDRSSVEETLVQSGTQFDCASASLFTGEKDLQSALETALAGDGPVARETAARLLEQFCDVLLPPELAHRELHELEDHRNELGAALRREIDFRVAALDYFINSKRRLQNPRVIELERFREYLVWSTVDPLTGVYNRRHLSDVLNRETSRARRYHGTYAVLFFDLDNFKTVNDRHGHQLGDEVLTTFAAILRKHLRDEDIPARYGGEEFVAVLPSTRAAGTVHVAKRILAAFRAEVFPGGISVTASAGVGEFPLDGASATDVLAQADRRVYSAKLAGKDTVVGPGEDQRRSPRYHALCPATAGYNGTVIAGATLDISLHGTRLTLEKPLPVGQDVRVQIHDPYTHETYEVNGTVVWSHGPNPPPFGAGIRCSGPQAALTELVRNRSEASGSSASQL